MAIHCAENPFPDSMPRMSARFFQNAQDIGSVLDGEEAVRSGLIDQLGGVSDALNYLHRRIEKEKSV